MLRAANPRPTRRRFLRDARGIAAVEFALILPCLLLLMVFGFQLAIYINATRKVELVAQSISQMISRAMPPPGSTTATVNATDLHFSYDSALVLFPYLMIDAKRQNIAWWQDITINYAGIVFTKIASNCNNPSDQSTCYAANVSWTSTGTSQTFRPCVVLQRPSDNLDRPDRTTLPRAVFGPASLIVIDVAFDFKPSFGSSFLPSIRIARSAYLQPRHAKLISFDTTNNTGIASKCPGY